MHRAALLALFALAPLGLVPSGAATCDPAGQVCWSEGTSGHCAVEGKGWSDVQARNVMLGFPAEVEAHGQYVCTGKTHVTRDLWANATAGTTAGVFVHWQSQATGWRMVQVQTMGPLFATTTSWWGNDTCHFDTTGTLAAGPVAVRSACPVQALPPPQPDVKWGTLLP